MKYLTKFVLKAVSILTIVAEVIFSLGTLGVIFSTIMMFIISGSDKEDFNKYILSSGNLTKGTLLLAGINAIVIFASLIITMHSLRRVVDNISNKQFFVASNLLNIKKMLISVSIVTLCNIFSMFFFASAHVSSLSGVFSNSWSQIGIYIIFVAILYTIYLVFKYGFELQEDSNTVI